MLTLLSIGTCQYVPLRKFTLAIQPKDEVPVNAVTEEKTFYVVGFAARIVAGCYLPYLNRAIARFANSARA